MLIPNWLKSLLRKSRADSAEKKKSSAERRLRLLRLEERRVLNASFAFDGTDILTLTDFDAIGGTTSIETSQDGTEYLFDLDSGDWIAGGGHVADPLIFVNGGDSSILHVDRSVFEDALDQLDIQIIDNLGLGLDVTLSPAIDPTIELPDSPNNGLFLID
ncbi:MAG: hypothetical protein AB8G99_02405, partial [Planctomycetaceae bacterium]